MVSFKATLLAACLFVEIASSSSVGHAIELPGATPSPSSTFIEQVRSSYDPHVYDRHRRFGHGSGYRYRRFYGGGLPPYGANTVITAPRGSAGAAEQEINRRNFCNYAPSRC